MKTKRSFSLSIPGQVLSARTIKLLGILGVVALAGCTTPPSNQPTTQAPRQARAASDSTKIQELKKRLDSLLEPPDYRYLQAGKTDPFRPFLRSALPSPSQIGIGGKPEENAPPERCETTLECLDVGQLKLVAIVKMGDGSRIAMAQDATGIGYILTLGTKVGYRKGTVSEIMADRLVIQEESEDIRGGSIIRERQLLLHPEEQR